MTIENPIPSAAPFQNAPVGPNWPGDYPCTQRTRVGAAIAFGWKRSWKNFWWLLLAAIIISVISSAINGLFSLTAGKAEVGPFQDSILLFALSDPSTYGQLVKPVVEMSVVPLALAIIGLIVQYLVTSFFTFGVIRTALAVTAGDRIHIGKLFSFHGFGRYIASSIIVGLLITAAVVIPFGGGLAISISSKNVVWALFGLVIAIVLAIVLSLFFCLFGYAILGEEAKGVSSLGRSWALVKPHFWAILGLQILLIVIVIGIVVAAIVGGFFALCIGLLATIPIAITLTLGIPALAYAYIYRVLSGQPVH